MNILLLTRQPNAQLAQVARAILRRGTRLSHYLLSAVGALAVLSAAALWLLPTWRGQLAARLMPIVSAAVQNGPVRLLTGHPFPAFGPAPQADDGPVASVIATTAPVALHLQNLPVVLGNTGKFDPRNLPSIVPAAAPYGPLANAARDGRLLVANRTQQLVSTYLARRYRVAQTQVDQLVRTAFDTGHEVGVDPLLLLAVMAIESGFNPYAESGVGAQGLMQVMSKVHSDKFEYFGGPGAALQPQANIVVGALVLKDCIVRGGSLAGGLRLYVGSTSTNDGGYGAKVLGERARLQNVARGEKVPVNGPAILSASTKLDKARPLVAPAKPAMPVAANGNHPEAEASAGNKGHAAGAQLGV